MNGALVTKRSYNIGPYEQLELINTINEVPENLVLDDKFLNLLRMFQFLTLEKAHYKYLQIKDVLSQMDIAQAMEEINKLTTMTLEELKKYIFEEETKSLGE